MRVMQYVTARENISKKPFFLREFELRPTGGKMSAVMEISVDREPQKHEFQGFGVAVTGSSCYLLNRMEEEQRDKFLNDIYGFDGLGLSVGRLSIGSSDYSAELYSYDDVPGDEDLEHFSVSRDEEYIIPMIREVLRHREDMFVFAAPWSPPGWMKTGESLCGGYMLEKYFDSYSDYLIKFLQAYEERGIHVSALSIQNEPETDQAGLNPACRWHPEHEARFIMLLKEKMRACGTDTEIWLHDHDFKWYPRVLWELKEYPQLLTDCGGVAFHYYSGVPEMMGAVRREHPDIKIHFTEGGPRLYDHYDEDWCKWGIMMTKALSQGCSSFTGWNLLLDETGGPNIGRFFCGGLATRNNQTGELTYSGQYRAFGHFSKYIRRGAKIYAADVINDGEKMSSFPNTGRPVSVCAARNTDGSFVLQITNPNDSKRQMQIFHEGNWWYVEALPDSVNTVVFN